MDSKPVSFYSDARRYDLVEGAFATGEFLEFYRRQVSRYGEPVLELACGSGRLTIPLAKGGINITGLDISTNMLDLAETKAAEQKVNVSFIHGDIRDFDLSKSFQLIFIAAQSLSHLYKREEIEACFTCVRKHLAKGGKFLIELFNPSLSLLTRDPEKPYLLDNGVFENLNGEGKVFVTYQAHYDLATQINHICYFYRSEFSGEEKVVSFDMKQFFPQEIDALLVYNNFSIEHKYGSYDETKFSSDSNKQLIVCYIG